MHISTNTVVTLDYQVTDIDHEVVDPGEGPLVYLHGADASSRSLKLNWPAKLWATR